MNAHQIQKRREELAAERAELKGRQERRRQEADNDTRRQVAIHDELTRLDCLGLLGVVGGVVMKRREPAGSKWSKLNDVAGTLTKVSRTWGVVDFGEAGTVNVRLDALLPATAAQRSEDDAALSPDSPNVELQPIGPISRKLRKRIGNSQGCLLAAAMCCIASTALFVSVIARLF